MENFITGHLIGHEVDVYCGGDDRFSGKIIACADGVLTIESEPNIYTHIAVSKIIAIWRKTEKAGAKKAHRKTAMAKKK